MKSERQDAKTKKPMSHRDTGGTEKKVKVCSPCLCDSVAHYSWPPFSIAPLLALFALIAGGCNSHLMSRSVNLAAWQKNVEHYVAEQGKGDPTVLRDVTLPDGRHGYSMLGGPQVEKNADASGVLLGLEPVGGSPTFVYLIGLRDKGKLTDIRLAAVNFSKGKAHWWLGRSNAASLKTYLKSTQPKTTNKESFQNFPAAGDVFKLNVGADRLSASHEQSGATWTVSTARSK